MARRGAGWPRGGRSPGGGGSCPGRRRRRRRAGCSGRRAARPRPWRRRGRSGSTGRRRSSRRCTWRPGPAGGRRRRRGGQAGGAGSAKVSASSSSSSLREEGLGAGVDDEAGLGAEHGADRGLDDGAVLVVHPAQVELAGGEQADHPVLEAGRLQALEPGLPGDRGHPAAQRAAKLIPLSGGMRLHLSPPSASPQFSTGLSTPVEKRAPCGAAPSVHPAGLDRSDSGEVSSGHPAGGEYMEWPKGPTRTTNRAVRFSRSAGERGNVVTPQGLSVSQKLAGDGTGPDVDR